MKRVLQAAALCLALWACGLDPFDADRVPGPGSSTLQVLDDDVGGGDVVEVLAIEEVSPNRGLPTGGELVLVRGQAFPRTARVFFCETEAAQVFFESSSTLWVTTPEVPAGHCDVTVVGSQGTVALLQGAFLFAASFAVLEVQPTQGAAEGGTPLTIRGQGFLPGTSFMLGQEMLESVQILDEGTALAASPPSGTTGLVNLFGAGPAGAAVLERAFTFTAPPSIDSLTPRVVSPGVQVRLGGLRLSTVDHLWLAGQACPILSKAAGELAFVVPDGLPPGPLTVRVEGAWGAAVAVDALEYLGAPWTGAPLVLRVDPSFLPVEGGAVLLSACGLWSEPSPRFLLGGVEAQVVAHDPGSCSWQLEFPPFAGPGQETLQLQASQGDLSGPVMTIFVTPKVSSLEPGQGPPEGLPRVTLWGTGLEAVEAVHLGSHSAPILAKGPEQLVLAVPPGGPGKRSLRLATAFGDWSFPDLWTYLPRDPALVAVTPMDASLAGGTLLELRGAGFSAGLRVFFGDLEAPVEFVAGDSLALVRTPAVPVPGDLALRLETTTGELLWPAPFTFFDPTDWNSGGLWGGELKGDLNVSVLDNQDWEPVAGATLLVECASFSGWKSGTTDDRGLWTLSEPGLRGPCSVHVSRLGSDAASVVGTGARNATLFIYVPKPTGPGGGGVDPLPDGLVRGSVQDARKYAQVPAGDCASWPGAGGFCQPCLGDEECLEGFQCVPFGRSGTFCSQACAGNGDCPERAVCTQLGDRGRFCVLAAGVAGARCFLSEDGPYSSLLAKAPALPLEDETLKLELVASPGERALVCFLGYTDFVTGSFVPQSLALRRHLTVYPGAQLELPPLVPEHRLEGSLMVHLPAPPRPPQALSSIVAFIDLGADGFIPLPVPPPGPVGTSLQLNSLPLAFEGSLVGAQLLVQAAVWEGSLDGVPVSRIQESLTQPTPGTSLLRLRGARVEPHPEAPVAALRTASRLGGALVLAGDGGEALWLLAGGQTRRQPLPVDGAMVASASAGTVVYLGGAGGALLALEGEGEARLLGNLFSGPVAAMAGNPAGRLVVAGGGQLAEFLHGELTWRTNTALTVSSLAFLGQDLLVLDRGGRLFARSPSLEWRALEVAPCLGRSLTALEDGTLLLLGLDCGALLGGDGTWADLAVPPGDWQVGAGVSGQALWLVDLTGRVLGLVAGQWTELAGLDGQRPLVAVVDQEGALLVGGAPGLLFHPMMALPQFSSPAPGQVWDQHSVVWDSGPGGALDSFNLLYLEDPFGQTIWRIAGRGGLHSLQLPDFAPFGFSPLAPRAAGLRMYSVQKEGHDFLRYNLYDFNSRQWRTWAYDDLSFR